MSINVQAEVMSTASGYRGILISKHVRMAFTCFRPDSWRDIGAIWRMAQHSSRG